MCRIDERIYVRPDGNRSTFQDSVFCEKGRLTGQICPGAKVRKLEYHYDPASSPVPSSPLTPTHNPRMRRGSTSSRPSTRDGTFSSVKPEIRIEIGSKKGKGKSYIPTMTLNVGKSKRESTGSTYTYESPGSEASHTLRTGLPELSPPLKSSHAGHHPRHGHHYSQASDESLAGSSHIAHGYHTSSDYDTPSLATGTTATSSGSRPIIHNSQRTASSSAHTTRGQAASHSSSYKTTEFVPREMLNEASARSDRNQRPTSSHGASTAPEIIDRGASRERQRAEGRRRQETIDREHAAAQMQEENARHAKLESARAKHRADERANATFVAHQQRRAEDRERIRQQQKKERDAQAAEEAAAKEAAEKEAAAKEAARRQKSSRQDSVRKSAAQAAEQQRLLKAEAYQMEQERFKAEAIEREERIQQQQQQQAAFYQQSAFQPQTAFQQQPNYEIRQPTSIPQQQQHGVHPYDPRASGVVPGISRRNSQSNQSRPVLGRTSSKRGEAPQARESRPPARQPPVSYYNTPGGLPQARDRRPPQGANPFGQPAPNADPWDVRNVAQALPTQNLPSARGPGVGHNFPQPQHATQRMTQAFYSGEYETDSDDEPRRRRQ